MGCFSANEGDFAFGGLAVAVVSEGDAVGHEVGHGAAIVNPAGGVVDVPSLAQCQCLVSVSFLIELAGETKAMLMSLASDYLFSSALNPTLNVRTCWFRASVEDSRYLMAVFQRVRV